MVSAMRLRTVGIMGAVYQRSNATVISCLSSTAAHGLSGSGHRVRPCLCQGRLFTRNSGVVDQGANLFAGSEVGNCLGGHRNALAGLGIAPSARLPLPRVETAEATDLDFFAP